MQTTQSTSTEQQLLKQLVSFGLNPQEWSLKPIAINKYFIENKSDQDFQFFGETVISKKQNESCWNKIQLISI